jgi:hypothetical protein
MSGADLNISSIAKGRVADIMLYGVDGRERVVRTKKTRIAAKMPQEVGWTDDSSWLCP